jgi:hypothetical protein
MGVFYLILKLQSAWKGALKYLTYPCDIKLTVELLVYQTIRLSDYPTI